MTKSDAGMLTALLGMSMIILLVLVLYLTQGFTVPGQNDPAHVSALVLLLIDFLVKSYSLLLGFGVCNLSELTTAVGGALRRRR